MKNCNNKSYPYKLVNVSADSQLITLWDGCNFVGLSVEDFMRGYDISVLAQLGQFADGTILMVDDGKFAVSPLSYDKELDAVVSLKRLIADDLQLSTETLELSQRVQLGAEGTIIKYVDEFNNEMSTPVITKYDRENGTIGTYSRVIQPETSVVIQPEDSEIFQGALYNPPPTVTTTQSNVLGVEYKFLNAGLNIRVRGTVETTEGVVKNLYGTDANPYNYFVTTGGTQFITFPGGIGNFPDYIYETYLEAYDPETNEATGEALNMFGTFDNGVFRGYAKVFFQLYEDVPFGTGGDVTGDGPAEVGDIPEYETIDGKKIRTSGFKASDFLLKTDDINKQSSLIDNSTTEIYEPGDIFNRFFYKGDDLLSSTVKLKNPVDEYTEQDRFQIYSESMSTLTVTDINGVVLQQIQTDEAYEFFYKDGAFIIETLKTRKRTIREVDVSVNSSVGVGPEDVGILISIIQSGEPIVPMILTLQQHANFNTGDVIEISASNSYKNYFFGVFYSAANGQPLVVYPNNSCRLTRTDTSWSVQQDGTFLRTGIRSVTSRNTPLEPDSSSMTPVNGLSIIDSADDIANYVEDGQGHRVLQLDFTKIPVFPEGVEYRFGVNDWYDNGSPAEYVQNNPVQFLEMECNGGYVNQVEHKGFGYTTYLRVYPGSYNTSKSVEFKDSQGRVSGRRTVRVGEVWKVTSAQKDADADVYWERIDDGSSPSDVYDGEFGSVSVAYNGLYGDDNRVFYPSVISQDSNGWTQLEYTGNLVGRPKDKNTGVLGDKTFQFGPDRHDFYKQPYYNDKKLATRVNNHIANTASFGDLIYSNGQNVNEWINDNPGYTPAQLLDVIFDCTVLGLNNWVASITTSGNDYNGTFPTSYQQIEVHRTGGAARNFMRAYNKESSTHYFAPYKAGEAPVFKRYAYSDDVDTLIDEKIAADKEKGIYIGGVLQDTINDDGNPGDQFDCDHPKHFIDFRKTSVSNSYYLVRSRTAVTSAEITIYLNPESGLSSQAFRVQTAAGQYRSINMRMGEKWRFFTREGSYPYMERIDDGTQGYVMQEDLVESFEANNDAILSPSEGVEFYIKDSDKDDGYGDNNTISYFQPSDGPIDLTSYLSYGKTFAVHQETDSASCFMIMHDSLVSELYGQSVDGIDKLSMLIKAGAKAAFGKANQPAPTGGVWNYQGFAIDAATTSDNANTTNPTKYLKADGTEATDYSDIAKAIYSSGSFKNDGSTLFVRGVVNFNTDNTTPNTFTPDSGSDYFVAKVTAGGGTFNVYKLFQLFMTKSNGNDMYGPKSILFDDAASAVGELLTICYDGAEEASAIAEAAKTSNSYGEFKTKIEQTTITETL